MAKLLTGTRIYGTGTVDTQLFVNGTEQAVSTTTGALEVIGGAGIGGNLHVGGISVLAGVQSTNIVASGTLGVTGTTTLTILNATSATFSGTLGVTGTSVLAGVQASNIVASGTLGVTGTSVLAGLTTFTNITSATSTTTGALQVRGGVGIGGALYVQETSYVNGSQILTAATIGSFGVSAITAGTDTVVNTSTGAVLIWNTSTLQSVTNRGNSTTNQIAITNVTTATSTNTGALQVQGGVGIGGNLHVGGISVLAGVQSTDIVASGRLGVTGTSILAGVQATNIVASGTLGVTGTSTLGVLNATSATVSGTLGVTGTSVLNGLQATNIVASGTLGVTGTSTLSVLNAVSITVSSTLGVTGTSVLNGLQATNIVASGTLGVTGTSTLGVLNATSATFSGTLGVTGTSVLAGQTTITNTASATSTSTGALVVNGGVGIGQDLRVGGVIYGTFNGSITGTSTTATNIAGGTTGQVPFQTAPGVTSFYGPGTAGNVLVSNGAAAPSYNNTLTLTGTTAATSTNTGALQVRGGVGVGGAVWANAVIAVNTISNGLNFANFVARPDGTTSSQRTGMVFYGTFFNFPGDTGPRRTADIVSGFATGTWGTEYLSFNVGNGGVANDSNLITTEQVRITTTTTSVLANTLSVSTLTGALIVAGGVGIGRSLFVQESIVQVGGTYSTLAATYNLINTTATTVNFAGAATSLNVGATSGSTNVRNNLTVAGNLTVQGTTTIVDSTVTNIADPIITLGGGAGNTAPVADDNKDRGIAFKWVNNGGTTSTGFFGYDDSTGYLTYIQTATITNEVVSGTKGAVDANLAGGTAMSLVYQSAADTTAFLAAGTSGFILQTNGIGSAPTWVSSAGIGAGSATNSDAIRTIERTTNGNHFLTFVDSNNATNAYESLYTTSSFTINPSTGNLSIGGALSVSGLYNSPTQTLSLTLGTETWVRLCTLVNRCAAKIQIGVGSSNSEEESEIEIFGTYVLAGTQINVKRQTYNEHLREVRVTQAAPGGAKVVYVRLRTNDFAPNINWRLFSSKGVNSLDNVVETPSAGESVIVDQNNGYFTNAITELTNTTQATSTSTGALQVAGGVGIGGNLRVGGPTSSFIGDVGIGIASASGKLHLYQMSGGSNMLTLDTNFASGNAYAINPFITGVSNGGFSIRDVTNSVERIVISATVGNVGVGTTSPTARLHVTEANKVFDNQGNLNVFTSDTPTTDFGGAIAFGGRNGQGTDPYVFGKIKGAKEAGGTWNGYLAFGTTRTSSAVIEAMRIDSLGNVLIGKTTPYNATTDVLTVLRAQSATTQIFVDNQGTSSTSAAALFISAYGGGTSLSVPSSFPVTGLNPFIITVNSTERLRITSNGGIAFSGATAYGSSGQILQSNGDAPPTWVPVSGTTVGTSTQVTTVARTTNASHFLTFVDSNNATATAEAVYTTSSFVINPQSGNVGLGTTTPQYELDVNNSNASTFQASFGSTISSGVISGIHFGYSEAGNQLYRKSAIVFERSDSAFGDARGKVHILNATAGTASATLADARITIDTVGNVGIGNTGPGHRLDVVAAAVNAYNQSAYSSGATLALRAAGTSANDYSGIRFVNSNGSREAFFGVVQGSATNIGDFVFQTYSGTTLTYGERMRVAHNGNVSIGTTSTTNRFEVAGTAGQLFSVSDSFTGTIFSVNDVSGIPSIEVLDTGLVKIAQYNGQVGISTGTVASGSALTVYGIISTLGPAGEIRASNEITAYFSSDERLKENVTVISNPIEIVKQIRGVYFDWTDEHIARRGGEDGYFVRKHDVGVIAQEVEQVLPEVVGTREDGFKAVKYDKIVALLVEAIKDQQQQIDELKKLLGQ